MINLIGCMEVAPICVSVNLYEVTLLVRVCSYVSLGESRGRQGGTISLPFVPSCSNLGHANMSSLVGVQ